MSVSYPITEESLKGAGKRVLHAGDSYTLSLTLKRAGVALNLTGATVWFTVKDTDRAEDANARLQLRSDDTSEIEITSPTTGQVEVKFVGTGDKSTASLKGRYLYDLQVLLSSGELLTMARGFIEFVPGITRASAAP